MRKLLCFLCAIAFVTPAYGRDPDGKYAKLDPKMHEWFDSLKSAKGPCCSDADGTAVSDADWESVNDPSKPNVHFKVRLDVSQQKEIDLEWVDVPDDAVLTQPNLYGKTMVWPIRGYQGITIRCFIPGPMT